MEGKWERISIWIFYVFYVNSIKDGQFIKKFCLAPNIQIAILLYATDLSWKKFAQLEFRMSLNIANKIKNNSFYHLIYFRSSYQKKNFLKKKIT